MPDVSLPPVGELVQITTADGWTAVGCRTGALPWVHAVGRPPVRCEDITSWCPVLVLPDTEATQHAVVRAVHRHITHGTDGRGGLLSSIGEAAWAAVRGAAIR